MTSHPLDRPVWTTLNSGWSEVARGDARAVQLLPDYGPFGAAADASPQNLSALAALDFGPDGLWTVEPEEMPVPPGTVVVKRAACHQMVAQSLTSGGHDLDFDPLGDADAPEMLALARLTQPGPFAIHTNRLGPFIGIRDHGRLVAMAGQRMRTDGFSEVSGVCTHPDYRGRGYAAGLMRVVTERILARGERAFLHTYADNDVANALYRTLGFAWRQTVIANVLMKIR